jgi:hypothetical protein
MSIFRCPHCKLPLVDEEARQADCPLCGGSLTNPDRPNAPAKKTAAPTAGPSAPGRPRLVLWLACAVTLALAGAPLWYLSARPWDAPAPRPQTEGMNQPASPPGPANKESPQPRGVEKPQPEPNGPRRKEASQPGAQGSGPKDRPDLPPTPEKQAGTPAAADRPKHPAKQGEVLPGNEVVLNNPEGQYAVEGLDRKSRLTLRGKVKTLKVGMVADGSVLDASGLEAREIVLTDRIDGGSTVRLSAPRGRVELHARVDGGSTLEVEAPDGRVSFVVPSGPVSPGSRIDGNAQVRITARDVLFAGTISGEKTHVLVTLTRDGSLTYREVAGNSRLHYRRAHRADPAPTERPGRCLGTAEVKYLVD